MFSSRKWLLLAILISCLPSPADAILHGSARIGGQTVINMPLGQFANLFKGTSGMTSSTTNWPSYLNADGYINSADPPNDIGGSFPIPFSVYYGHYTVSYAGCGSLNLGSDAIVYSGGTQVANLFPSSAATGSVPFNFGFQNQCNPNVEFAFGALIGAIADNGSGKVRLTALNTGAGGFINLSTGTYQINNINGIAPGLYTLTFIDNNHFDILSLAYNGGTMSINGGGPGTQSELIYALSQGSMAFSHGFTTSWTMSNAILARTVDYANVVAGQYWNPDLVTQFQTLKPGFARFLDVGLINQGLATNYTYRAKTTNFTWDDLAGGWVPSYYVGTITNGGSDAYTSANPAASPGSGAYVDGEVVQGQINTANTTNNPTLALSGRSGGAKPILSAGFTGAPAMVVIGGTATVGDVINFKATATYISGGNHTASYTLVSGDTNLNTLASHLAAAINADTTFQTANIVARSNSGFPTGGFTLTYNRNGQGVAPVASTTFSVTVTGVGGETFGIGTMPTPAQDTPRVAGFLSLQTNALVTLVYSKIQDAWIADMTGLRLGAPIEAMAQFCNNANVGCWINVPILYSGASVTALTQTVASNLNSNLKFTLELSNEVWNFNFYQTALAINLGASLGFLGDQSVQLDSFYGLRFKQFTDLETTAWTGAGRSTSLLSRPIEDWILGLANGVGSESQLYRLSGTLLTTTNLTYNALAGLGGAAGTTYTANGSRPVDVADCVGTAPYWTGALINQFASDWSGVIGTYATILQAGKDYATGNQAAGLAAIDTDARNGFSSFPTSVYTPMQNIIASYDSFRTGASLAVLNRCDYEGGDQEGMGDSGNGTNATTNTSIGYAPLSAQFTALGWDTSAYGASNDIVAQQVVTVYLAWKNSSLFQATVRLYLQQIATASTGRQAYEAWYGYTGPSQWEFYPASIYGTPQQSYNAFANWP